MNIMLKRFFNSIPIINTFKKTNICIMINSKYFFKSPDIYYLRIIGGIIK